MIRHVVYWNIKLAMIILDVSDHVCIHRWWTTSSSWGAVLPGLSAALCLTAVTNESKCWVTEEHNDLDAFWWFFKLRGLNAGRIQTDFLSGLFLGSCVLVPLPLSWARCYCSTRLLVKSFFMLASVSLVDLWRRAACSNTRTGFLQCPPVLLHVS